MKLLVKLSLVTIFFLPPIAGWAGTQEEAKVVEQPSVTTTEPWIITVDGPGWLAGVSGHTGFHSVNPYVSVGVKEIIDHVNAIAALGGEVRRGRFGVLGDYGPASDKVPVHKLSHLEHRDDLLAVEYRQ
jgi:hypothetical protein